MADKKLSAHPAAVSVNPTDTVGVLQPNGTGFSLRLATVKQLRDRQFFTIDIGSAVLPYVKTFRLPVGCKITELRANISSAIADDIVFGVSPVITNTDVRILAGQTTSKTGIQPSYTGQIIPDDSLITLSISSASTSCNDLQVNVYYE